MSSGLPPEEAPVVIAEKRKLFLFFFFHLSAWSCLLSHTAILASYCRRKSMAASSLSEVGWLPVRAEPVRADAVLWDKLQKLQSTLL